MSSKTDPSPDQAAAESGIDLGLRGTGLTFQTRIAVVALVTAVAVLMAACLLFMLEQWRTEQAHFVQNQTIAAKVMAGNIGADISRAPAEIRVDLDSLRLDPRIRSAIFVDAQGKPAVVVERAGKTAAAHADGVVVVASPVMSGGVRKGMLVISSDAEGMSELLPRFISMGGALFFVAAGMALFMGRWLAGRLTRPVERLSNAMQDVAGSGDFERRVQHGENDEFGRLTESFNALLAQLHANDQELRLTMDALVEARDAAEAANVLKSHFLANMSHEIRTPLNGVLAMSQIMAMGEMAPAQRQRLDVIRQSGEALLTVLNDILDLSKIEAGRMELESADFDAGQLVGQLETLHGPLAAKKGLAFSVEATPQAMGMRHGDHVRLQQILNNLVANAIKFTASGEVRVQIDGDGEGGDQGLKVSVTDTGIGIATDKLPLLFQKFTQVDSSTTRKYGGTGLGLAICRELAQLMGGTVRAESVQGLGSTFFVSLPMARATEAAEAEAKANAQARPTPGEVAALRVLAAEDNPTNQLVLKTVLATFGLDVHMVENGRLALEAWAAGSYDLILMDIQMPVMDGINATRAIRASEMENGLQRTPIIALSANAMTHQVKEYLAAGMDMHVAKPIQLARLYEAFEAVLNGQAEASGGERELTQVGAG